MPRHLPGRFFRQQHFQSRNSCLQQSAVGPNLIDLFFDMVPNKVPDFPRELLLKLSH
jgi:hypothetical protein